MNRTRFAPSPTGPLHLGHAFAALTASDLAGPGQFLLRIEDIDAARCRPVYETMIAEDLRWLGLDWQLPVMRQSQRLPVYQQAIDRLTQAGLTYPCQCNRADIRAALAAPQEGAALIGPDGPVYPGTCRNRSMTEAGPQDAIRLNAKAALEQLGMRSLTFLDINIPTPNVLSASDFIATIGDVVLARRGMGTSYHLSVVLDDAEQGITLVTRGQDLFDATWIHVLLQNLLELPTPRYHHHRLIRDEKGQRLAKRDDARALRLYRDEGLGPQDIRQMLGL